MKTFEQILKESKQKKWKVVNKNTKKVVYVNAEYDYEIPTILLKRNANSSDIEFFKSNYTWQVVSEAASSEKFAPVDSKTRNNFLQQIKKFKFDGNGRFDSLKKEMDTLAIILDKFYFQYDDSDFEKIFRGDNDVIGDKNRTILDIKRTKSNVVVSWEHKESGYSIEVYLS